jgi:transposase
MKKSIFIGIDVSKDTLDVSVHSTEAAEQFIDQQFTNNTDGFNNILYWINSNGFDLDDCLFCMEHTGVYSLGIAIFLYEQGLFVSVVPALQIKRSLGIVRGKNDKVDARRIASFAMDKCSKLKPYEPDGEHVLRIKQLLTYRDQLRRICSSLKNSRHSHKGYTKKTGQIIVLDSINNQIEGLEKEIYKIEKKIKEIIKQDKDLNNNFKMATSVKGVGLIVGAYILVTTSNFKKFSTSRKYCCYIGVAPFPNQSGTSIKGKTRVSNLANKRLKTLLHNSAGTAIQHDPEIKNYYQRKLKEGKDESAVKNAVCNKIVHRVFAAVKRQTPYVSLYKEKIFQKKVKKNLVIS